MTYVVHYRYSTKSNLSPSTPFILNLRPRRNSTRLTEKRRRCYPNLCTTWWMSSVS